MKIRLRLLLFVVVSTIGLLSGAITGDWSYYWILLPLIIGFSVLYWGVVSINSQMFLKAECDFTPDGNEIMLTFDDGPDPEKTPQIIALLEKYNAKAVFFCIGKKIDQYPETAKLITDNGHVLGSHSYHHGFWFDILSSAKVADELRQAEQAIKNATGKETIFFRPPYGITNPNIGRALKQFNYRVIGWNIRSFDTMIHEPEKLEKRVLKRIKPGSIILLHDTAPAVLPVLESLLSFLKDNGYRTKLP